MAIGFKSKNYTKKPDISRSRRRTVSKDGPREVDISVGKMLRRRRILCGLSQSELASSIDISFQQLQKYEKGLNRISASKLWQLSQILNVPVNWFFEAYTDLKDGEDKLIDNPSMKRETLELVRNYIAASPEMQRNFLSLVKSVAKSEAK